MRPVHVVVPDGIDDPARPSGGNTYDRHVCRELRALFWSVHEHAVPGFWTHPGPQALGRLQAELQQIPNDAVVLIDGLIASTARDVVVAQAGRLRVVVLVHMPLGHRPPDDEARRRERAVLSAAVAVITTSTWARRRLAGLYALPDHRLHVAEPGVEAARLARMSATGGALLCVASVTFAKGHDLLLDALESTSDLSWRCTCVGSLDRDRAFVECLRRRLADGALCGRVLLPGSRTGADLDREYASADLLVVPSRAETYGMVITEALARGVPVLAAEVGGVSEALGEGADGTRPGLLVAPEDPAELAGALRAWLADPGLRARLRRAAVQRRASLSSWSTTAAVVARVLAETRR